MNTTVLLILLVVLVIINVLILVGLVIWRVIFKGSTKKLLMSFLGLLVENSTEDHKDEAIEMDKSERKADIMVQKAEALNFEDAVNKMQAPHREQAIIPPTERGELARETSDNGWPRELDKETRFESRPFLDVHLRTETVSNPELSEDEANSQNKSE